MTKIMLQAWCLHAVSQLHAVNSPCAQQCSASIQKSFVKNLEALSSCCRFVWDGYLEFVVKDGKEIVYENKVAECMCRVSCVSFIKIVQGRIRH